SRRELFQGINSELLELLHRLFEACPQAIHSVASPSPSLGERENRPPHFRQSRASRFVAAPVAVFPARPSPPAAGGGGVPFALSAVLFLHVMAVGKGLAKTKTW